LVEFRSASSEGSWQKTEEGTIAVKPKSADDYTSGGLIKFKQYSTHNVEL